MRKVSLKRMGSCAEAVGEQCVEVCLYLRNDRYVPAKFAQTDALCIESVDEDAAV